MLRYVTLTNKFFIKNRKSKIADENNKNNENKEVNNNVNNNNLNDINTMNQNQLEKTPTKEKKNLFCCCIPMKI